MTGVSISPSVIFSIGETWNSLEPTKSLILGVLRGVFLLLGMVEKAALEKLKGGN